MQGGAGRSANLDLDVVRRLRRVNHFAIEQDLDARTFAQAFENELRGLELLALHHDGMARVVLKNRMVELRDEFSAWSIPELEDRCDQTGARHIVGKVTVGKAVFGQEIECRRMRRRGARVGLRAAIVVEQANGYSAAADEPCAKEPDRPAPGDQDLSMIRTHSVSLSNRDKPRDRGARSQRFLDRRRGESEERRPLAHRDNQ